MKLVQLPDPLKAVVIGIVASLVTQGLKALSAALKLDLSGLGSVVTFAVTSVLFAFADTLLALIPSAYEGVATAILMLLVTLLGGAGFYSFVRGKK